MDTIFFKTENLHIQPTDKKKSTANTKKINKKITDRHIIENLFRKKKAENIFSTYLEKKNDVTLNGVTIGLIYKNKIKQKPDFDIFKNKQNNY